MTRIAIIVTGLPASGKTRVGRALATALGFAFLDKDTFLEALYEHHGATDPAQRHALSRQSDLAFQRAARAESRAVLVSHWRPASAQGDSGTPTDWLAASFDQLIEVHCACPLDEAVRRFVARTRHPGHLDDRVTPAEVHARLAEFAPRYPLGLGTGLSLDTGAPRDLGPLIAIIRASLDARAP